MSLNQMLLRENFMGYSNQFFRALGIDPSSTKDLKEIAKDIGIPIARLVYYNVSNIVPSGRDLEAIKRKSGISELELKLKMGRIDRSIIQLLQEKADCINTLLSEEKRNTREKQSSLEKPVYVSPLGSLYQQDCLEFLKSIESDTVDLVFADPPFNLDKMYPSQMNDNIREEEYLDWTEEWLKECARILKPGGSLFIWNLPIWNSKTTYLLHGLLTFKHWIATDIKYSLPIQGRLYPSHYSLLYFVKGEKANKLNADRLPTPTCPSCFGDLKDYGGYKHKMNPLGVSMTDVWTDIPPVRHAKYKKRVGANELPVKLLDRIIEMSTNEGDLIVDPFGGSGTTYVVAEMKRRRWLGCEVGPCTDIINRFAAIQEDESNLLAIRKNLNSLFPPAVKKEREMRGLWTAESVSHKRGAVTTPQKNDLFD